MSGITIGVITLFVLHVLISIYTVISLAETALLTKSQKRLNMWLTTLVPFIWALVVYYFLKREPDFSDRENTPPSSNNFYESREGFLGGGSL
jgi:hypothetical protein